MKKITAQHYLDATGVAPEQDDLERCNCDKVGQTGHSMCGWNWYRNMPNFWPEKAGTVTNGDHQ